MTKSEQKNNKNAKGNFSSQVSHEREKIRTINRRHSSEIDIYVKTFKFDCLGLVNKHNLHNRKQIELTRLFFVLILCVVFERVTGKVGARKGKERKRDKRHNITIVTEDEGEGRRRRCPRRRNFGWRNFRTWRSRWGRVRTPCGHWSAPVQASKAPECWQRCARTRWFRKFRGDAGRARLAPRPISAERKRRAAAVCVVVRDRSQLLRLGLCRASRERRWSATTTLRASLIIVSDEGRLAKIFRPAKLATEPTSTSPNLASCLFIPRRGLSSIAIRSRAAFGCFSCRDLLLFRSKKKQTNASIVTVDVRRVDHQCSGQLTCRF